MQKQLTIELVPQTAWFSNVRSMVSKTDWDTLRKEAYKKANYKCEICCGVGSKHPVECHEIWQYENDNYIQKLMGLIALCPSCHEVKHIGLATVRGRQDIAKGHLAKINNWSHEQVNQYVDKQFEKWQQRSKYEWEIDLDWLGKKGIKYKSDRTT